VRLLVVALTIGVLATAAPAYGASTERAPVVHDGATQFGLQPLDAGVQSAGPGDVIIFDSTFGFTWLTSLASGGVSQVGEVSEWPLSSNRVLGGDIQADGAPDAVLVKEDPSGGFTLHAVPWHPDGYYDTAAVTQWGGASTGGFSFDSSRQLMGDVTGDGLPDVVTIHDQSTGGLRVWLHENSGFGFEAPVLWQDLRTGGWSYDDSRQTLGDVNGDGMLDLVSSHRQSTGGLRIWVHLSSGSALAAPSLWEDLRTGGWSFAHSRQVAGDIDGDGTDDIVTSHRQSTGGMRIWAHISTGAAFAGPTLWQDLRTGGWSFANSQQFLIDTDASGTDDLISPHRSGNNMYRVWIHPSTGTSFSAPGLYWDISPDYTYDGTQFAPAKL
jgi:hypothetical protein